MIFVGISIIIPVILATGVPLVLRHKDIHERRLSLAIIRGVRAVYDFMVSAITTDRWTRYELIVLTDMNRDIVVNTLGTLVV